MKKCRILFMGRKNVASRCLAYLAERDDVEIVGILTDNHLAVSPTNAYAMRLGIEVFSFNSCLESLNSGELSFDLGLSMLYWRKLKAEFLTVPCRGVINFHPAPLPDYKGTAGYNMAILNGLTEWATTAHYVDEEIDTGEIIDVKRFPISPNDETAKTLEAKSQEILFSQFVEIADRAINAPAKLDSFPNQGGIYISRAQMEAMKEIKAGDDVARKVRAFWFPPYDGAFINIDGVKYTLVDRTILQSLADSSSSSLFTPPGARKD